MFSLRLVPEPQNLQFWKFSKMWAKFKIQNIWENELSPKKIIVILIKMSRCTNGKYLKNKSNLRQLLWLFCCGVGQCFQPDSECDKFLALHFWSCLSFMLLCYIKWSFWPQSFVLTILLTCDISPCMINTAAILPHILSTPIRNFPMHYICAHDHISTIWWRKKKCVQRKWTKMFQHS